RDRAEVEKARADLLARQVYGKISLDLYNGTTLPYAENLVNLLIVDDPGAGITRQEMLRVLTPNGVALVHGKKIVKPIPEDIDEWTHFEHGPENNSVAADTQVGPPRHLQWVAGPRWLRTHEVPSGLSSMVTAGGRLFYTLDEGPIGISDSRLPEQWSLIARDAYNGTQLWKIPVPRWGWQTWNSSYKEQFEGLMWIKSGGLRTKNPAKYVRRMVADDKRLYFTLGHKAPVSVIDAANGRVIAQCEGSDDPEKLLLCEGVLCVQLADGTAAYDARTGRLLWKKDLANIKSMAAHDNCLLYHTGDGQLTCLDLTTADELWWSKLLVQGHLKIANKRVLSVAGSDMQLFSLQNGESLWCQQKNPGKPSKSSKETECYIIDDTIWTGYRGKRIDLQTGEALPALGVENLWSPQHHHRCYTNKATSQYIIGAMEGMEFLDLSDENHSRNNWVRGSCRYGIMPANGMTYVPPDQCYCSAGVKLLGLNALTGAQEFPAEASVESRLARGPFYGEPVTEHANTPWPAYRKDALRSGSTTASVSAHVKPAWQVQLDPTITQPVVSEGRLFIASRDTHTVHAVDSVSGKTLWQFTADGRVDSPPTCWKNLLLFGSAQGTLFCVRQEDGGLVWTFRAAPHERVIQSFGQLESAWPLHGSVLILDDLAYVAAGRSTFLDGGLYLYALEPSTGKVAYRHQELGPFGDHTQGEGHSFWSEGARNDVLVSDGESIYIMQLRFNKKLEPDLPQTESLLGDRTFGRHVFS
ncbi:MAG: PQQ-binding-like beta-propeller repeat protein, partial [Planctomycetes bacterium]|nr:PQQ-binding-like beta-propeller repeat protein [Planctomycetota bacterium]